MARTIWQTTDPARKDSLIKVHDANLSHSEIAGDKRISQQLFGSAHTDVRIGVQNAVIERDVTKDYN